MGFRDILVAMWWCLIRADVVAVPIDLSLYRVTRKEGGRAIVLTDRALRLAFA